MVKGFTINGSIAFRKMIPAGFRAHLVVFFGENPAALSVNFVTVSLVRSVIAVTISSHADIAQPIPSFMFDLS